MFVLDLPFFPNGTYPPGSYEFLPIGTTYKYLFSIGLVRGSYTATQTILISHFFGDTIRAIRRQHMLPLYGFGILRGMPIPSQPSQMATVRASLNSIYQALSSALQTDGVRTSEICNFIAFKPSGFIHRRSIYEGLLNAINRVGSISIVFILTVTDEHSTYVLPSSAWNHSCQPHSDEVKMEDVVELISSVPGPNVNFTLTLSLRFDIFRHVVLSYLGSDDLDLRLSFDRSTGYFDRECEDFFLHDPRGATAVYFGGRDCMFAPRHGTHGVVSFETPDTLRHKMIATYRHLGYAMTGQYVIGWSIFNVTHGLAPQNCNGTNNRIHQIRKVLDDNK